MTPRAAEMYLEFISKLNEKANAPHVFEVLGLKLMDVLKSAPLDAKFNKP
jgi:hypothetical protein